LRNTRTPISERIPPYHEARATKEIKARINESVQKVGDGSDLVNQSGQNLAEIVNSVKRVTDTIAEISAASQEQVSGIAQVNKAVLQMDQSTQQNAALVEETTLASQSMKQQAEALLEQVAFFKSHENNVSEGGQGPRSRPKAGEASHLTGNGSTPLPLRNVSPTHSPSQLVGVETSKGSKLHQHDDEFLEEF